MPIVFDATLGGASATSYASLSYALDYFERRPLSTTWAALEDDVQENWLMLACNRLEEIEDSLAGYRVSVTQALSVPRWYPYADCSASYCKTAVLNGTEIPKEWKDAQCELAFLLMTGNKDTTVPNKLAQFRELSVPGVRMVMADYLPAADALPDTVLRKIARFRTGGGGLTIVRV